MTTLTSRQIQNDLTTISKITLDPGEVLIIRPDMASLNQAQRKQYADAMRAGFSATFPNNNVIVLDKSVDINIVTINP